MCVTDTAAPQAGGVQDVVLRCECERRIRMQEIFPLTGVAVLQVDEEGERAGMPTPDHVGKTLQSLVLSYGWDSEDEFTAGERLVYGLLLRFS